MRGKMNRLKMKREVDKQTPAQAPPPPASMPPAAAAAAAADPLYEQVPRISTF